jgi:hypothetical protein
MISSVSPMSRDGRKQYPLRLKLIDSRFLFEMAEEDGESINHSIELLIGAMRKAGYKSVRDAVAVLEKRDVH